jgi:hypothetical protein
MLSLMHGAGRVYVCSCPVIGVDLLNFPLKKMVNQYTHIERVDIIFYELNHLKKQGITTISFVSAG